MAYSGRPLYNAIKLQCDLNYNIESEQRKVEAQQIETGWNVE